MNRTRIFSLFFALLFCAALFVPSVFAAAQVPDAPELTVTQLAGKFSLSWSTPYNGGSKIQGFQYVYYLSSEEGEDHAWINVDASRNEDTTPALDNYGREYTFRIRAINKIGNSEERVVEKTLLHQNHMDVARVRDRVEAANFSATLQDASSSDDLKAFLEAKIAEIDTNVAATVNITSYEPAQLTKAGSFQFTVSLSLGNPGEPTYASTITEALKGDISSSTKLSTPKISLSTAADGGLSYEISTTGTAAQAEAIQSFEITVYDTANDQAVVTDYNISATEKSGIINLSAGLVGENSYRASVKACSADSLKYLDSDLSEPSAAAAAGRIPITIAPSITQKYYGDTEPIFGYEIVSGPNPLPTGVQLSLTFTRAEGADVGTYGFSFQQTDTNYEVTLEDSVFEILPRAITIRPADREVTYTEGTTFLLQEVATADGLVSGDEITELEFDPADARGDVGEYEITPKRVVITSGGVDVTKNYTVTFESGKLKVLPLAYNDLTPQEPEKEPFPLWIIFVILAVLLLIAGGIVLFFLLRKKPSDYDEADYDDGTDGEDTAQDETADEDELGESETDAYEEYLEIIDLEDVEAAEEPMPDGNDEDADMKIAYSPLSESDSTATQATIEEIETAQAKTEIEEE